MGYWETQPLAKQRSVARHRTAGLVGDGGGFTLIELMFAVALVGILSALAMPNYFAFIEKAKIARTVAELNMFANAIRVYAISTGQYPSSLAQIALNIPLDPWGNPYQYYQLNCEVGLMIGRLDNLESPAIRTARLVLPVSVVLPSIEPYVVFAVDEGDHQGLIHLTQGGGGGGPPCGGIGGARKDRFLVPINSDFDLYSMGQDGESVGPLTAQKSHDDIIRANDGGFYGLAANF